VRLERISWVKAEEYFKENDMVLLITGSLECHGRHLPLGTDTLIPNKIAELIEEKSDVLIAPTLPYGVCDYLTGYPGTVSLGDSAYYQTMSAIVNCLRAHGARKFAVLNGHGGNRPVLDRISSDLDKVGCIMVQLNWWLMAWDLDPAWKGGHGGGEETAGVMAVDPGLVDKDAIAESVFTDLSDEIRSSGLATLRFENIDLPCRRDIRSINDNGWAGPDHPKYATEEWGNAMVQACADYIVRFLEAFKKVKL